MPETASLFDKIAKHYDPLNTLFSLGMDRLWRKRLADQTQGSELVLDIATGTAEVAIETSKKFKNALIIGIDPSWEMLSIGNHKVRSPKYGERIKLIQGMAENLPFRDGVFDSITIAFGIRNTVDPLVSLKEMQRVLKPGGKAAILEFAIPSNTLFAPLYLFYFKNVLPLIASVFGSKKEYKYLSESTSKFPQRSTFTDMMKEVGLTPIKSIELTMGIAIIYVGSK